MAYIEWQVACLQTLNFSLYKLIFLFLEKTLTPSYYNFAVMGCCTWPYIDWRVHVSPVRPKSHTWLSYCACPFWAFALPKDVNSNPRKEERTEEHEKSSMYEGQEERRMHACSDQIHYCTVTSSASVSPFRCMPVPSLALLISLETWGGTRWEAGFDLRSVCIPLNSTALNFPLLIEGIRSIRYHTR